MRDNSFTVKIGGTDFKSQSITCDICGWGDLIIHQGIFHNNTHYDFCKRHTDTEIRDFLLNKN